MKYLITFLVFMFLFAGTVSSQPTVTAIVGGGQHSLASLSDGTVLAWGANEEGQLGIPGGSQNVPVTIPSLTGVTGITTGTIFSLAMKSDGTVWGWGYNGSSPQNTPVQVIGLSGVIAVSGGTFNSLALKGDGTVWKMSPYFSNPIQVSGLTGVTAIAAGHEHSLALKSDGTVWAWGSDGFGQLGTGGIGSSNIPTQVVGLAGVIAITAAYYHSLALKLDGTIWTWGRNNFGQLGGSCPNNQICPTASQIPGLTEMTAVVARYYHSVALKSDGTVWGWGGDSFGGFTPTPLSGFAEGVAIATGWSHALVVKSDGTLWAWGDNTYGQLGNGTFGGSYPNPAPVLPSTPPPPPSYPCTSGTVNTAHGPPINVLFVNGSPGNTSRIVNVAVNAPITITLAPPPFGPLPAPAVMWAWVGAPTSPTTLTAFGQSLGCMANPPSFMPTLSPQPFTDVPTYAPGLDYNPLGISFPVVITLQGLMIDFGAGNPTWMSITNAVIVNVQ